MTQTQSQSDSAKKPSRKKWILVGVVVFLFGILASVGFTAAVNYTNTLEFCVSCHSQQIPFEELKETFHWKNPSGVHAECPDCHVPKEFFPKMYAKVIALKDVYHEWMGTIDTREKYEARRWEMAQRVWAKMKATDSRECKTCHSFDKMDLSFQDRFARKKHEKALEQGETCIDCHKGIAHEEPEEPEET